MCLPNMNIPIEVDCNSGYIKTLGCFWFCRLWYATTCRRCCIVSGMSASLSTIIFARLIGLFRIIICFHRLRFRCKHNNIWKNSLSTYGASLRTGLLCSEYPSDSKGKTGNQWKSPFRLCNADKNGKKRKNFIRLKISLFPPLSQWEGLTSSKSCRRGNSPCRE